VCLRVCVCEREVSRIHASLVTRIRISWRTHVERGGMRVCVSVCVCVREREVSHIHTSRVTRVKVTCRTHIEGERLCV